MKLSNLIGFEAYRIRKATLLDSKGQTVWSDELNSPQEWRTFKERGMMQRLFDAARQLSPFGNWKVINYRFVDGAPDDSPEFRGLLGTRVRICSDRMEVRAKICSAPSYQSKSLSNEEFFRQLGTSTLSVGLKENHAETTAVKCESNDWQPRQSLLVKLPKNGLLMLWQGVFLVLKEEDR